MKNKVAAYFDHDRVLSSQTLHSTSPLALHRHHLMEFDSLSQIVGVIASAALLNAITR